MTHQFNSMIIIQNTLSMDLNIIMIFYMLLFIHLLFAIYDFFEDQRSGAMPKIKKLSVFKPC